MKVEQFLPMPFRTVVLQAEGNTAVSQVDSGQEVIFKTKWRIHNPTGGGIWDTIGDEGEKNGFVRDVEGTQLGKDLETKAKGLFISELHLQTTNVKDGCTTDLEQWSTLLLILSQKTLMVVLVLQVL